MTQNELNLLIEFLAYYPAKTSFILKKFVRLRDRRPQCGVSRWHSVHIRVVSREIKLKYCIVLLKKEGLDTIAKDQVYMSMFRASKGSARCNYLVVYIQAFAATKMC